MPEENPLQDPQAALRFTRALAALLQTDAPVEQRRKPELSIVIPVFNERNNLEPLVERLRAALAGEDFEIVFVDDGSRDGGTDVMCALAEAGDQVVLVELSRNFGHQVAITAGLDHASGRGVIIMDADLQDPPEVLPRFIARWREGADVVYAIRKRRKESWIKRVAYNLFYRVLQRIASIEIPLDAGDFCIMDRRVVDVLGGMPERNRFVRGIRSWVGLEQVGLEYERERRYAGHAKFNLTRLVYLALDGLVSFSYIPLRAITVSGFAVSGLSILLAVFYALQRITVGLDPPGFATIVVAIFFLAGIQLVTLGVIGEYVGRIFEEVKRRPIYVVRKVTGLS